MANPTPGVTGSADKTPDEIEREMEQTRESITEKVSLLENQVVGLTSSVTETVQAVKDAVTTAPNAVSDTVKQTVAAVKDSVKDTVDSVRDSIGSFSVSECVRGNPLACVGASTLAGFLAGYFFGGSGRGGLFGRPIMAQGSDTPASFGHTASAHTAYGGSSGGYGGRHESAGPGFLGGLLASASGELRQLAEQALSTAVESLKQTISTQVPQMVDTAVHGVTDRVASAVSSAGNGDDTSRVGGPTYTATPPANRY